MTLKQTEITERPTYYLRGENARLCIQDFKVCTDFKVQNTKYSNELTDRDQISIVSDVMFKTMLATSTRKKFPCKLLAGLLENSFEELMENSDFYKNELDKTSVESKGERSDLVLKIGGDYITVEMNMRNEISRNIEYADRFYSEKVKVGEDYVYSKVLSVNINNFYFEGCDKIIDVFYFQNDEGQLLDHKVSIQIYLPLLRKKCYNQGEKALNEWEKTILVMTSPDRDYAIKLAKDDVILEEYLKESKHVEKYDNFLREAYDHELSGKLAEREEGIRIGIEQQKEVASQEKLESAKRMIEDGFSLVKIKAYINLSDEEIEILNESDTK